jgi:phage gp36-like protein
VPYATQADLVPLRLSSHELVQLTDDAGLSEVNAAIVTAALEEASGTVESYCRRRYATPLQASDMVKARTLDIAVYLLFSRKRNAKMGGVEMVRQRYDDAVKFLEGVAAGRLQLDQPLTATPQASTAGAAISRTSGIFSDDNLAGFR